MREPAVLQKRQTDIAVLDNGVARPAADAIDRRTPDQAHRAVHDDSVDFVTLDHADIEEAGIFGIHRPMQDRAVAITMVLRRLDETDARIGKYGTNALSQSGSTA